MNREITLVTAFFDIGRGNLENKNLQRSNEKYFKFFEHWARMKNNLIVYTQEQYVEEIIRIRAGFGLKDKTTVITIDDIYEIEPEIFNRMVVISQSEDFKNFRYYYDAFSNTAKYDYIMLMKYWFLHDAKKRNLLSDKVSWFDFGFDHGGALYPNSEEFDFLWDYDFSHKINIFSLTEPNQLCSIDSLQFLKDCIMGYMVYMPIDLVDEFWDLIRSAMNSLLMLDCIDDDQQLLLMAYKARPDLFDVHISDWFLPLKEFGASHLSTVEKQNIVHTNIIKSCLRKVKAVLKEKNPRQKDFSKRALNRALKYYR